LFNECFPVFNADVKITHLRQNVRSFNNRAMGYDQSGAPRQQLKELTGLAFIERKENLILLGPSGVDNSLVK